MKFKSGFIGVKQDAKTGALCPAMGWWIVDTSPKLKAKFRPQKMDEQRVMMAERNRWSRNDTIQVQPDGAQHWLDGNIEVIKNGQLIVSTRTGRGRYELYGDQVRGVPE